MPRLSRLVVPGHPHHITQRGVRSMNIFDNDQDRLSTLHFIAEGSNRFGVTFMGASSDKTGPPIPKEIGPPVPRPFYRLSE